MSAFDLKLKKPFKVIHKARSGIYNLFWGQFVRPSSISFTLQMTLWTICKYVNNIINY